MVNYSDADDHYQLLEGIDRKRLAYKKNRILKTLMILGYFLFVKTDVVISFGQRDNFFALIPLMLRRKIKVIAGERNVTNDKPSIYEKLLMFYLYKRADFVVPNSYSQRDYILKKKPQWEKKGLRDAHASKGYRRKAGKTKGKGGPQRYRQSCPGGSSSFPIERAASQHAPPKQMRAPAISISTSHKMISLWGKLSTNSNRTKRQASPILRMARPNSLPGLPLSPAPIQAPKAMMANAPKKMPKKLSTRTSR